MKVLMVGLGGIGQRHLRNLRTLLGSEVEVIAYRVRKLGGVLTDQLKIESETGLEEKYGVKAYYGLDEALAQKPDAAFICNPSSLHIPVALACANAGCHLFIEKPLSHDMEGIEELIRVVDDKSLVGLVGYQMRFHPCLKRLHSLIQNRAVGDIVAVRAEVGEYLPGWHTYEDYRQMYASRQDLGGGVILSQIHEMDYLYWMFGLPKQVFTLGGHLSSLEIDVEDTASIMMDFMIDQRMVPVHLHEDYVQRPPTRTCHVIGDQGKILVDLRALTVNVFDGNGDLALSESYEGLERNQLFLDEMAHFLACIRGEEEPMVSIYDGAQSLKMALAAKTSLVQGRPLAIWSDGYES